MYAQSSCQTAVAAAVPPTSSSTAAKLVPFARKLHTLLGKCPPHIARFSTTSGVQLDVVDPDGFARCVQVHLKLTTRAFCHELVAHGFSTLPMKSGGGDGRTKGTYSIIHPAMQQLQQQAGSGASPTTTWLAHVKRVHRLPVSPTLLRPLPAPSPSSFSSPTTTSATLPLLVSTASSPMGVSPTSTPRFARAQLGSSGGGAATTGTGRGSSSSNEDEEEGVKNTKNNSDSDDDYEEDDDDDDDDREEEESAMDRIAMLQSTLCSFDGVLSELKLKIDNLQRAVVAQPKPLPQPAPHNKRLHRQQHVEAADFAFPPIFLPNESSSSADNEHEEGSSTSSTSRSSSGGGDVDMPPVGWLRGNGAAGGSLWVNNSGSTQWEDDDECGNLHWDSMLLNEPSYLLPSAKDV